MKVYKSLQQRKFFLCLVVYRPGLLVHKVEYDGKKIKSIEYSTVDYNGGLTTYYLIDFQLNY